MSDADSLIFLAQSSEECVCCIWNSFCYRVWFICKPHRKVFINLLKVKCSHFDEIFIIDCTGRHLPVQPVFKISSKWKYFRFSARASWIILTFGADLVHVYITRCGQVVYSYKKKFIIHVIYVGISQLTFSMYLFWIYVSIYIICKQSCFVIITPIWVVKWTFIWHFRVSMNQISDFVKSLRYQ